MNQRFKQVFVGVALMAASVVFFVVMNSLTKYCLLPSSQKVFIRSAIGIFAVFSLVRFGWARMEFNNIPLLALRGTLGAIAVTLYFHSIDNTTLGRASFFQFTYPAWGALFSYLFLRESLGWKRLPALLLTFAGGYLILVSGGGLSAASIKSGDISGILCGLASGAAVTSIRACHKYDSTYMIFLFFASFGMIAGAAITFAGGPHSMALAGRSYVFTIPGSGYVQPSTAGWLLLVSIGLSATVAQLFFTAGYRYLDVAAAGSIAMLQAPLSALVGFRFFGDELAPRFVLGGILVLVGGMYLAASSRGMAAPDGAVSQPPST